jgi:hypothetical protein
VKYVITYQPPGGAKIFLKAVTGHVPHWTGNIDKAARVSLRKARTKTKGKDRLSYELAPNLIPSERQTKD